MASTWQSERLRTYALLPALYLACRYCCICIVRPGNAFWYLRAPAECCLRRECHKGAQLKAAWPNRAACPSMAELSRRQPTSRLGETMVGRNVPVQLNGGMAKVLALPRCTT